MTADRERAASLRHADGRLRAAARAGTLALALLGCSDATHVVGQLQEDPAPVVPQRPAARQGEPAGSAGSGGVVTGNPGGAGGSAAPSASAGGGAPFVPPENPAAILDETGVSCSASVEPALRQRLDLYLMVDRNVTLAVPWTQITSGIARYADNPAAAGTGLGVGYFPPASADTQAPGARDICDPDTYALPETPVALLPGNAAEVKRTIPPPIAVLAGSPTKAALQGAHGHTASRWNSFDHAQAVVMITDEVQDFSCFVEPRELEDVAAMARAMPAAVPTYVIALTVPEIQGVLQLLGVAQLDNLDAVARNGGTVAAHEISLNLVSGIADAVAEELLSIQRDAEPCLYQVPESLRAPAAPDDLDATVLGTAAGNGDATALRRVRSAAECGQGYYLDDEAAPTWAVMCPSTCRAAKLDQREVLWLAECAP